MSKVKLYLACAMTGRMQDEMRLDADMLTRVCTNFGFEGLSPVIEENIQYIHEPLAQTSKEQLDKFWARDKELIKDCDILLDYMSCNKSDGVSKEIGLTRFCYWKPVVRVWPNSPLYTVSRIEDDVIVSSLLEAMGTIRERWGDYEKLGRWRKAMLDRCFAKWMEEHHKMNARYGINTL